MFINIIFFICYCPCQGVKAAAFGGTGGIEFVDHRITMALNVLSWLCDGQRRDIQDVLREEKIFSVCL